MIVSNQVPYEHRLVEFTLVTDLLTNPWDVEVAAADFLTEITETYAFEHPVFVIAARAITAAEVEREEIDYQFTVMISSIDMAIIERASADSNDYAITADDFHTVYPMSII